MDGMDPIQDRKESSSKGDPTVKGHIHGECQENRKDIQGGSKDQPRRLCRGDDEFGFFDGEHVFCYSVEENAEEEEGV